LYKKSMKIMIGINSVSSCRPVFKALKILKVVAQYLLPLIAFVTHNLEHLIFNNSILKGGLSIVQEKYENYDGNCIRKI